MPFQAIGVRQHNLLPETAVGLSRTRTLSNVAAGSTLILIGSAVYNGGAEPAPYLNAVSDTSGNTWTNLTRTRSSGAYSPQVFCAIANNVAAAASLTVTAQFLGTDDLLNNYTWGVIEVEKAAASALEGSITPVLTTASAINTTLGPTGTLSQTDNLLLAVVGGWIGDPSSPAGWNELISQTNGETNRIGLQVSAKTIATTDPQTVTVGHDTASGGSGFIIVLKAAAAGGTIRYRFSGFNPAVVNSGLTGVEAHVWRNGAPWNKLAERYEGLAGDDSGAFIIDSGLPGDVAVGDSVTANFRSASGFSDDAAGVVEEV